MVVFIDEVAVLILKIDPFWHYFCRNIYKFVITSTKSPQKPD